MVIFFKRMTSRGLSDEEIHIFFELPSEDNDEDEGTENEIFLDIASKMPSQEIALVENT